MLSAYFQIIGRDYAPHKLPPTYRNKPRFKLQLFSQLLGKTPELAAAAHQKYRLGRNKVCLEYFRGNGFRKRFRRGREQLGKLLVGYGVLLQQYVGVGYLSLGAGFYPLRGLKIHQQAFHKPLGDFVARHRSHSVGYHAAVA